MQHVIKKQVLEFGMERKQNPFQLQEQMSRCYHQVILPLLSRVFDELSREDVTISLDSVVIDLGCLDPQNVVNGSDHEEFYLLLMNQVKQALGRYHETMPDNSRSGAFAQWVYYMRSGFLHWSMRRVNAGWFRRVLEILATDFASVTALRRLILYDNKALERIIAGHDADFLVKLSEIMTATKQRDLAELAGDLISVGAKAGVAPDRVTRSFWTGVLKLAAADGHIHLAGQWSRTVIKIKDLDLWLKYAANTKTSGALDRYIMSLTDPSHQPASENLSAAEMEESIKTILTGPDAEKEEGANHPVEDEIFISLAGLVILHPFLPALFNRLGYIAGNLFVNDEARQKSLYALYYLATGSLRPEEYELAMPKILTGYPLKQTVRRDITLTSFETAELNDLLLIVIQRWEILKGTSVAGLREGFLIRDGKYYRKDDRYFLHVENASIDMLLDRLPWTLNFIKLPWMKDILQVEWR